MSGILQQAALWSAGALLILGQTLLQGQLDQWRSSQQKFQQLRYLPDGQYLRAASLGYRELVADVLWLQIIQAMGERKVSKEVGSWLYRAFDIVTTVDPRFVRAYEAGGIALCTLVVMPEESNSLLEKGMLNHPDEWKFPFLLGINYYFELYDDAKAADYIARAARLSGAPEYLPLFAARLYASAREPQQAIEFLVGIHERTTDEGLKRVFEERLKETIVERDLQLLERVIAQYGASTKTFPGRLEDLVVSGFLRDLPGDPFGGEYVYDATTHSVRSAAVNERLKVKGSRRPR
jgi:hypothetical protein